MPSYLYSQNVSARDRFTQIELQLDNGKVATLRQGNAYDLTATEVARARSFVTMVPSGSARRRPESPICRSEAISQMATCQSGTPRSVPSYQARAVVVAEEIR
jgi:hypothetical protein